MKSFQEFREQKKGFIRISKDLMKLVDIINRRCEPYLKEPNIIDKPLLRGAKGRKPWETKKVKSGRKPKDTLLLIHNLLDEYFLDTFGHRYRSHALFCSTDMEIAAWFGTIHLIFPVGKYEFISSRIIRDLTEDFGLRALETLIRKAYDNDKLVSPIHPIKNIEKDIEAILNIEAREPLYELFDKEFQYSDKMNVAETDGHEIMMNVGEYISVNMDRIFGHDINQKSSYWVNKDDLRPHISGSIYDWGDMSFFFMKLVKGHFNKYLAVE